MTKCSKPGCGHFSAVLLAYDYSQRRVMIEDPVAGEVSPHLYPMCLPHAERLTPPRGWTLEDRRSGRGAFFDEEDPLTVVVDRARRRAFFGSGV